MAKQQIVDYIENSRHDGLTDSQIKDALYTGGWTEKEVDEAFAALAQPEIKPEVKNEIPQAVLQNERRTPKRGGKLVLLAVCVVVVVAILGAGAALATRIWDPSWNPFGPSPETVITKAWNNLSLVKSESFNSKISISSKDIKAGGNGGSFDINLSASGAGDTPNKLADLQASLSASATDNTANKYNISLAGEAKILQSDLYFQLSDINLGGLQSLLQMFGAPDFSTIQGKWIRVQLDNATQQDITQQIQAVSGQQAQISQNYKDALNKIAKILLDKKVYDVKQLADNQGSEGAEYHYFISLDQKKLLAASPDIFSAMQDYYTKANPGQSLPSGMTLADFQKGINDIFAKIGKIGADVFIGKSDNFFHKIAVAENIDISKFTDQASGNVQISIEMDQSGINKPVEVSAPASYTDFKDLFPSSSSSAINSDMEGLNAQAQIIYADNNSYSSLCVKGLLNGYQKQTGAELIRANNDIIKQGAQKPACFASAQNFCVSTQLADKSFVCQGPGVFSGTTKCVSALTVCK